MTVQELKMILEGLDNNTVVEIAYKGEPDTNGICADVEEPVDYVDLNAVDDCNTIWLVAPYK